MMLKKTLSLTLPLLLLTACSGDKTGNAGTSNDSVISSVSSKFIDAPVAGLNYTSTSFSGVTGAGGVFQCSLGERVTFKLGSDLSIGSAACGDKIFLSSLDSKANQYKIGGLLQSFGIIGNEITIPMAVRTYAIGALTGITTTSHIAAIDNTKLSAFVTAINGSALALSLTPTTISAATTHVDTSMSTYQVYSTEFKEALDHMAWFASSDGGSDIARYNPNEDLHIQKNADTACEVDFYLALFKKMDTVNSVLKENYYVLAYTNNGSHVNINTANGELIVSEVFSTSFSVNESGTTFVGDISAYVDIPNKKVKGKMNYIVTRGGQPTSCTAVLNDAVTFN